MQISRFTSSKPSKFAFASDEKSIRQPTTSFVRCYLNPKSCLDVEPEGDEGAIADFVCFHCPLVASAEAKPLLAGKTSYGRKSGCVVAPIWRDNVQVVERASWGRV